MRQHTSSKVALFSICAVIILYEFVYSKRNDSNDTEEFKKSLFEWFSVGNGTILDPFVNLHEFSYILSSHVCSRRRVDVLIFVHSSVQHLHERALARETWANVTEIGRMSMATVFMVALTTNKTLQKLVEIEAHLYGDIVQGRFIDAYRNLTYKHLMAYHWILTRCEKVFMIVKADDDVMVNVHSVASFILNETFEMGFIYCSLMQVPFVQRGVRDKWRMNISEYPFSVYPPYCSGRAYLMSPEVAASIYGASYMMKFFWVDDVFVTGVLALKVNALHSNIAEKQLYSIYGSTDLLDCMFIEAKVYPRENWEYLEKIYTSANPKTFNDRQHFVCIE